MFYPPRQEVVKVYQKPEKKCKRFLRKFDKIPGIGRVP
jgi:hypothetical protein